MPALLYRFRKAGCYDIYSATMLSNKTDRRSQLLLIFSVITHILAKLSLLDSLTVFMGNSTEDEKPIAGALAVEDEHTDTPRAIASKGIDKGDLDRAFVYLSGQNQSQLDNNVDLKALRRKIDWRIIPVMTACYGLQFLDKVLINVSLTLELWDYRS